MAAVLPSLRGRDLSYPVLLSLGALDAAGYSVIGPALPSIAVETGASARTLGWLTASFPLTMLLGFLLAVRLQRNSRPAAVFVGGLALVAVGSLAFVLSSDLGVLFAGRMTMGLGSGALWIAVTFRTMEYWPGEEYRCMSRVYAAYSVGAMVGPVLGGLPGAHAPFLAYLVLVLVAIPVVLVLPAPAARLSTVRDLTAFRLPGFWFAALGIMFAMMAPGVLDGVLPLHFATRLSQAQIALAYACTGILIAVAATSASRLRPGTALALGGVGLVAGVSVAGLVGSPSIWLGALALIGLGMGATETGATGVLLEAVPTERIVTAMVVWSQIGMLGYLLAPALGAPLAEAYGFGTVGLVPLVAGAAVVVAGLVAWPSHRRSVR